MSGLKYKVDKLKNGVYTNMLKELDALAESEMYDKYNLLINGKTSVFISHRLSPIKFCDRIIMLDYRKIIKEGTHE